MSRFWAFRSTTNFLITSFGICSVGLYGYQIYKEEQFNHPIITEAVKNLSNNQRIRQIIGYPLSYKGGFDNSRVDKGNEVYYSFKVDGPRATIEVQMNTKCKNPQEIGAETRKLVEQIKQLQDKLKNIKDQMSREKDMNAKNIIKSEQKLMQSELKNRQEMVKEKQYSDKSQLNRYYVPSNDLYNQIISNKIEELPPSTLLWGIQSIVISLPNRTKMTIYDSQLEKKKLQQIMAKQNKEKTFKIEQIQVISPPDTKFIKEKLTQAVRISEDQIQQYTRNKANFMNSKYGSYRMMMALITFIGAGLVVVFLFRNRHKSLAGSLFLYQTQKQFLKNPKIRAFISQRQGAQQLSWNTKLVGGGQQGNSFDCQIDVNGVLGGKAILKGIYEKRKQKYKIQTFIFQFRDKQNKKQRIDLI